MVDRGRSREAIHFGIGRSRETIHFGAVKSDKIHSRHKIFVKIIMRFIICESF